MSNSNGTGGAPLHGARLPFGEESTRPDDAPRIAGIVSGNEKQLADAVVNMLGCGGGISFAGTSDGGAVSVTVFFGRERQKKYAASPEALSALLEAVCGWTPAKPVEIRPTRLSVGDRRH